MSRIKRKRKKIYTSADSTQAKPTITRVSAPMRSPLGEWWVEHKKQIRYIAIAALVIAAVAYLLFELIRLLV